LFCRPRSLVSLRPVRPPGQPWGYDHPSQPNHPATTAQLTWQAGRQQGSRSVLPASARLVTEVAQAGYQYQSSPSLRAQAGQAALVGHGRSPQRLEVPKGGAQGGSLRARSAPKGHSLGRAFPRGIPGQKGSDQGLGPGPTLRRPHRFHVPAPLMPATFLLSRSVPSSLVTIHPSRYHPARHAAPFRRPFSVPPL